MRLVGGLELAVVRHVCLRLVQHFDDKLPVRIQRAYVTTPHRVFVTANNSPIEVSQFVEEQPMRTAVITSVGHGTNKTMLYVDAKDLKTSNTPSFRALSGVYGPAS